MAAEVLLTVSLMTSCLVATASAGAGNFYTDFEITWGGQRAKILDYGRLLMLSLDRDSGSGFRSKKEYLFTRVDMQLKVIHGESAGTVTGYYFTSQDPGHDEIDLEFLGNVSGQPYTLSTNVFIQGNGNREQQFMLWFDPTRNFHTYTLIWNLQNIIFLVDDIPIRVFENKESKGVPYPKQQPMRVYASLWHADWATQGGRVNIDWSKAPFTTFYRNFEDGPACMDSSTSSNNTLSTPATCNQGLDASGRVKLRWAQQHYMTYNYCTDFNRFPQGLPRECLV